MLVVATEADEATTLAAGTEGDLQLAWEVGWGRAGLQNTKLKLSMTPSEQALECARVIYAKNTAQNTAELSRVYAKLGEHGQITGM